MKHNVPPSRIAAVRRFNRFHTKLVGALNERLLSSEYSLPQVRVLYELAQRSGQSASDLKEQLSLDAGYLSRLLAGLQKRGLVERSASSDDARRHVLSLSKQGADIFAGLDAASANEVKELLEGLTESEQDQLVAAMQRIERLLGGAATRRTFVLRDPQPGDLGWIVHRHGALYAKEYGFDASFEALVADIVGKFVRDFDAKAEKCWVAVQEGEIVGSVFLVRKDDQVAKLRLLYVEPHARGMGLGKTLVDECCRFARNSGYERMTLWTNDCLDAAIGIYKQAGFEMTHEEPHKSFGCDLVGQTWEREL